MIRLNELIPVATVNKTHGIRGELSVTVDPDVAMEPGMCLITPVEGIPVPFFVASLRPRSADTFLITLDGIDSDIKASFFTGATFYADPKVIDNSGEDSEDDESEGFYASMLIGMKLRDTDGSQIGTISDIDDSTQNVLLIVDRPDGSTVMVPLANDLITDYNTDEGSIEMNIPAGLLDMQ